MLAIIAMFTIGGPMPLRGEVFGDVKLDAKYLAGAEVKLTCGTVSAAAKTDSTGAFRVNVKGSGKCELAVSHDGHAASMDVVVFDKPAQYHVVMEQKDGKYLLRRV